MAKDLALVLNSGSLNSAVITALAAQRFRTIMVFADIAPGSARHRAAYDQQIAHFKPYREHTLAMPYLSLLATPADTQSVDPRQSGQLAPQLLALLPIIAAASSFAAHYQAAAVYVGLRIGAGGGGEELSRATEYTQIINELLQIPCGQVDLEVITPLLELDPWQVVDLGFQVNVPFEKSWSCNEEGPVPCGSCRGCRGREQAFMQAAKPDPLKMTAKKAG